MAAAGAAAMPVATAFWQLLAATAAQGAGVGFMDAGGDAMLMWSTPQRYVGPAMQAAHAMFGVGHPA